MSCQAEESAYDEIYNDEIFDEDGRPKRTGKIYTCTNVSCLHAQISIYFLFDFEYEFKLSITVFCKISTCTRGVYIRKLFPCSNFYIYFDSIINTNSNSPNGLFSKIGILRHFSDMLVQEFCTIIFCDWNIAGTLVTTVAHIITTLIGSGVLSLAWAVAQLGWIAGTISLVTFSLITLFTSHLLADCYRAQSGKRSYSYMDAVKSKLGNV